MIAYYSLPGLKFHPKINRVITKERVISIIAGYFDIPIEQLSVPSKRTEILFPRQVAMYFIRKYTILSYRQIGFLFCGQDHSTAIHAVNEVNNLMHDCRYKPIIDEIESLI
jgi:chromosomal replication initiator protein